ncbi:MAG: hypothetical protein KF715_09920 [Candidatus Didemnitutus sp.]|nr:hypothetical protein [Candidatus Didemnitutus sp.]
MVEKVAAKMGAAVLGGIARAARFCRHRDVGDHPCALDFAERAFQCGA